MKGIFSYSKKIGKLLELTDIFNWYISINGPEVYQLLYSAKLIDTA